MSGKRSATLVRVGTLTSGAAAATVSARIVTHDLGINALALFSFLVAVGAWQSLFERGRSAVLMNALNDPTSNLADSYVRASAGLRTVSRDLIVCSPAAAFAITRMFPSLDPLHGWLVWMILSSATIATFALKSLIATGHQATFFVFTAVAQWPAAAALWVTAGHLEPTNVLLLYFTVNSGLLMAGAAIRAPRMFSQLRAVAAPHGPDVPVARAFLWISLGLGLLGQWDRVWAAGLMSQSEYAVFALVAWVAASTSSLSGVLFQSDWRDARRGAFEPETARRALLEALPAAFTIGALAAIGAVAATALTVGTSVLATTLAATAGTAACLQVLHNVSAARLTNADQLAWQARLIWAAVLVRGVCLSFALLLGMGPSIALLASTLVSLAFLQAPVTFAKALKWRV